VFDRVDAEGRFEINILKTGQNLVPEGVPFYLVFGVVATLIGHRVLPEFGRSSFEFCYKLVIGDLSTNK